MCRDETPAVKRPSILTGNAGDFLKIGLGAARRGDLDSLKQLLRENPEWRTKVGAHGRTMLWEASYRGRLNVVSYLLDTFDDIDLEARGCYYTPLLVEISSLCAARYKKRDAVAARLEAAGAVPDIVAATFLGDIDNVESMIEANPKLVRAEFYQHLPQFNATLMHYAVSGDHHQIVRILIHRDAELTPYSDQLLNFAIGRGNPKVLRAILEAGVDTKGKTLLRGDIATEQLADILTQHGAKIEIDASDNGWPALVYVCRGDRGGDPKVVQELLDQGANVNIQNSKGQTALHCATKAGFVGLVKILLAHGANVNAQDNNGDTPLHAACKSTIKDQNRLQHVVELIGAAGADLTTKNNQGRTPKDVVRKHSTLAV